MSKEILNEIRELRQIVAKVIGTSDKPEGEQFSIEAIERAAKEYQQMTIERGGWLEESQIHKVIRNASLRAGEFLIEHFAFTSYFKKGRN